MRYCPKCGIAMKRTILVDGIRNGRRAGWQEIKEHITDSEECKRFYARGMRPQTQQMSMESEVEQ